MVVAVTDVVVFSLNGMKGVVNGYWSFMVVDIPGILFCMPGYAVAINSTLSIKNEDWKC